MKDKSIYGKMLAFGLIPLVLSEMEKEKHLGFPIDASQEPETFICKNCGNSFIPRSHNKKVFCSTQCFLEHKKENDINQQGR